MYWLTASCIALCFLLYFLAENGRINAFATYLLALCIVPLLFFATPRHQLRQTPLSISVWCAALLAYLAISAAWADESEWLKHVGYAALIASFIVGVILATRQLPDFLPRLITLVVACAFVSAVVSISLHYAFPEYKPLPEPRLVAMGRLFNPVISATSYGFAIILGVALLHRQPNRINQALLIIAILVLLTAVVLTGSRTVWLALGLSVGTLFALKYRKWAPWILIGSVIVSGVAMTLFLGLEALTRRALSHRPEIWQEFTARTIDANLLIGLGSGQASYFQLPDLLIQHPHSIFVSTFYFGGLIGLILLICLIFSCVRHVLKSSASKTKDLVIITGVFGLTIGSLDGDNLLTKIDYLWWIAWFPVALCLTLPADPSQGERT